MPGSAQWESEWAKDEKCPSNMQCVFHPYYFSFLACNVAGAQGGELTKNGIDM